MLASTEEALARHTAELKIHHERLRVLEVAMRQRVGQVFQAEHTVHGVMIFDCPCEEYRHAGPISVQRRVSGVTPDPMPHWVCEHCSETVAPWESS